MFKTYTKRACPLIIAHIVNVNILHGTGNINHHKRWSNVCLCYTTGRSLVIMEPQCNC